MIENIPEKTGKTLEEWKALLAASGLDKHKAMMDHLKGDHGLTHGYANLIVLKFREADAGSHAEEDLIAAQYAKGKEHLKPIYDTLTAALQGFGKDVELAPKKAYVSVRRKKQFAILQASTKSRFDLGLNLKGKAPEGNLEAAGSWNTMCTHRVKLADASEIDASVLGWLKEAYEAAG